MQLQETDSLSRVPPMAGHTNHPDMQRDIFERLTRIDYLIRIKGTGTPAQLAERLNLSERSIYDYISFLKSLGCPIKFDSYRESYYYEEEGSFIIAFHPKSKLAQTNREQDE